MGLFDKVFGGEKGTSEKKESNVPWNALTEISQLDELEKLSEDKTVTIFKHSTTCGISRMVLKNFEADYEQQLNDSVDLYFLDLKAHRDISNGIAEKFSVRHESPQMVVLKNREVVHHSSHQAISVDKLKELA
ncbi:bacillithiol system redox-active protein YtxJ [Christiangramia sp. ASW11-125]|uniref:bacillithiol system redox-active protein YtxJ n=1 Tax=Christiangramia sp. ASW11-125 TaxID=3400701 RepID=UPI003AB06E33